MSKENMKHILDSGEYQKMTDEEKIFVNVDLEKTERFINLVKEIYDDIYPDEPIGNKHLENEMGKIESFTILIVYEGGYRKLQSKTHNTNKKYLILLNEINLIKKAILISKLTGNRDMRGLKIWIQ